MRDVACIVTDGVYLYCPIATTNGDERKPCIYNRRSGAIVFALGNMETVAFEKSFSIPVIDLAALCSMIVALNRIRSSAARNPCQKVHWTIMCHLNDGCLLLDPSHSTNYLGSRL